MSKSKAYQNPQSGFSLISLSMLLIVLGLFTVAGIYLSKQYSWTQKQSTSTSNIAAIEGALKTYQSLNGMLPCPASLSAGVNDANFGRASDCSAAAVAGVNQVVGRGGAQVRYGAVPVRSLNLPDSVMVDGWNHRLIYAVTQYYTVEAAGVKPNFDLDRGAISIVDGNNQDMTPAAPGRIIFAVISPGADKRGAFTLDGRQAEACPAVGANVLANENCDTVNATFRSAILRQWDTGTTTYTSSMKYAAAETAYQWVASEWGACPCGSAASPNMNPVQTRTATCQDRAGVVSPGRCLESERPVESQSCTAFCWALVPPAECNCSTTSVSETVKCERRYNGTQVDATDGDCTGFTTAMGGSARPTPQTINCATTMASLCNTCTRTSYSSSGGGGGGGGGGGSSSSSGDTWDVDGDGFGDFESQADAMNAGYGPVGKPVNTSVTGYPPKSSSSSSSSSSSGSNTSNDGVASNALCTYYTRERRWIKRKLYLANLRYGYKTHSQKTINGYHLWAIPLVKFLRRHKGSFIEKAIFKVIVEGWVNECAYREGVAEKGDIRGKIIFLTMVPICSFLGNFAWKRDCDEELWKEMGFKGSV